MQTATFDDLFAAEVGSAFARQLALADLIGNRSWSSDMRTGRIAFGDDLSFPIQVLGSRSDADDTWLWGWANQQSNFPAHVLSACSRIKQLGTEHGIKEFTEPGFVLDAVSDHMLAMLCGGLIGTACYYRAPQQGGAAFLLLEETPDSIRAPAAAARVNTVLMQVISNFDIEHRPMAESFLRQQGFVLSGAPASIQATRAADDVQVQIAFDEYGRITRVDGRLKPAAPKKSW
jgi:hypothetical protein